ncbi:hypothetical protein [Brevundimonas albigilva]|uniref:Uncharacterized protein n=1 Tax=Brevundimonas albigilva TaxID=1312364 RepID=A0ABY4SPY1_9CAUL|nr:hypothetical protein [Brevundimonas albigilva]URI15964.1 hypothetical protein M8231_02950 [Brevundimonas albigilva]
MLTKSINWVLSNAPTPLTAREIVDIIDAEGDVFETEDAVLQRKRVVRRIYEMTKAGTAVAAGSVRGERRWAAVKLNQRDGTIDGPPTRVCLSDTEWEKVCPLLPSNASDPSRQAATREFLGHVSQQVASATPSLPSREAQRFLSWHGMKIWNQVATALPDKFSIQGCNDLAERLVRDR